MEKRVVMFLVASAAVLIGWSLLARRFAPEPLVEPAPVVESSTSPVDTPPVAAAAPPSGVAARGAGPRPAEELTRIERKGQYLAVFSTWGASPVEFTLDNPQYRASVDGHDQPINLIKRQARLPPYAVWLSQGGGDSERSDVELAPDAAYRLERHGEGELLYSSDAGDLHVEKRWSFPAQGYRLGLEVALSNRGTRPLRTRLRVGVEGWHDPTVKPGGWSSFGRRVNLTEALCEVGGKLKHDVLESLQKAAVRETGDVRWIGIGEQFFVVAAAFTGPEQRTCELAGEGSGRLGAQVVFAEQSVLPGQTLVVPMAAFAGPKLLEQLDAVTVGGSDPRLGDAVNYTLEFVARPMLAVLKVIQRVVVNWGLAIIVITVLLKLVMLYPTQQSMKSAKAMARLKPEMDAIKTRFPDDKARQAQEQQALFKKHGVSPLGGCLPALLQMPIYIAFYSMLSNAVELYRSSFIGPIDDMTAPFWPLSLVTGVLMFVQQLWSPQALDPQQKQMMYMMPIMFMVFTLFLPSGLTLYILTNTVLTMVHQFWMNRHDPGPAASDRKSVV
jgi:YidC/Oxa1 family membrane protein insertase